MPHQAALFRLGDLPDAEETQDVVDAEGVEVFGHLAQAALPPGIAVFCHFIPVVGGEAPVLAVFREGVRRCAGLRVHVEELRVAPGVHAGRTDADRKVALEDDALGAGVCANLFQLFVEVELLEAGESDLLRMGVPVGLRLFRGIDGPLAPFREVGRAELVAQGAENGVGEEPVPVVLDEGLVFRAFHDLAACRAFVYAFEQAGLLGVDADIVDLRQGVELRLEFLVGGRLAHAGGGKVEELRMQGKGAVGIVGVRVHPVPGHRGIVDREQLEDALARAGRPVGHLLEVVELSDAEVLFAAQREDGDGGAGAPVSGPVEGRVGMGPQEAGARGRVDPAVVELRLAPAGLPAVGRPLLADDHVVPDYLVAVFLQQGLGAGVDLHAPEAAFAPGHRVFLSSGDEGEALSPLGPVFNRKLRFHDVICLNRDKYTKFLPIFER